jgi:hypothetical protein
MTDLKKSLIDQNRLPELYNQAKVQDGITDLLLDFAKDMSNQERIPEIMANGFSHYYILEDGRVVFKFLNFDCLKNLMGNETELEEELLAKSMFESRQFLQLDDVENTGGKTLHNQKKLDHDTATRNTLGRVHSSLPDSCVDGMFFSVRYEQGIGHNDWAYGYFVVVTPSKE